MSLATVNHLNTALMILSLALAFALPFELFLFSYAILGPAHYLTEISWLHDRQYFTPHKLDYLWLVGLSLLVFAGSQYALGAALYLPGLQSIGTELIFAAFGAALILVVIRGFALRLAAAAVLVTAIVLFRSERWVELAFAIYLPTLIHVYLFTGAFILYGALKSHSKSGYLSFLVFIACALVCVLYTPRAGYAISDYVRQSYDPFSVLSVRLILDFNLGELASRDDIYFSSAGETAMRFIAFAYTYHYLNWFSKTSIIRWHKISRSRYIVVCLLWLVSIGIYIYDYGLGFRWLFLLSFAHVFLEFPLNHQSFIGIGKLLRGNARGDQVLQA